MTIKFTSDNEFTNSEHPDQRFRVDYEEDTKVKTWRIVRTDGETNRPYGHIAALGMTLLAYTSTMPDAEPEQVASLNLGFELITD